MSTIIEYTIDFPELAATPDVTYAETLLANGMSEEEVFAKLLLMDITVKQIVTAMRSIHHLAFAAPETIDSRRIIGELGWHDLLDQPESPEKTETLACVAKATRILRGEMEPHSIWSDPEEA